MSFHPHTHSMRLTPRARDNGRRFFDAEFLELVERCMRLSRENVALQEQVERLEAELEDHRRDQQARERADSDETDFQMHALAADASERAGWVDR